MPHRYLPPFGCEKGDTVTLTIKNDYDFENAVLAVRYRTSGIEYIQGKMVGVNVVNGTDTASFMMNGKLQLDFEPTDNPVIRYFELGKLEKGDFEIRLDALGTGGAEFDFFCICEKDDASEIKAEMTSYDFMPEITTEKCADEGYTTSCRYKNVDGEFILRTFNDNTRFREIESGALEDCMTARLSNSDPTFDDVAESFTGAFSRKHSDDGFFRNSIIHTIFINPDSEHIEYAVISKGKTEYKTAEEYEKIYESRLAETEKINLNKDGKKYELSNEILRATAMVNAVYPIYKHGEYIIHHTPGLGLKTAAR